MRITNNTLHQRVQHELQRQLSSLGRAHERVLTGRRINTPSDDPAGTADVLAADSRLRALTQYRRNVDSAHARLTAEEGALDQLTNVLSRALELAVAQGSDTANAQTRAMAGLEVAELLGSAVQLGNTQVAGRYIFGGAHAHEAPLRDGDIAAGFESAAVTVAVDRDQEVLTTHDADAVFGATGALDGLRTLRTALENGDAEGIRAAVSLINDAISGVQDRVGEVGARLNRLEIAATNIDALTVNVQAFRAGIADADFESAITDLVNRQTTFQAALMATSRMMTTTLTDYLR